MTFVALGLGLALAADTDDRRAAQALEAELRFADAAAAWARCATTGPDRDRDACARAAERLRPQAADGYAGWTTLARVRRDYRTLGPQAASAAIQAALDAQPDGPAAPELRRWLVAHALEKGELSPLAAAVAAESPTDARWIAEQTAQVEQAARHRTIAGVGAVIAGAYGAIAAWGRPRAPLAWRSAGGAFVALGLAPLALATAWDPENLVPFAENAAWVTLAVLFARRSPPALAAFGTVGGLAALAWRHGWLAKMGVP